MADKSDKQPPESGELRRSEPTASDALQRLVSAEEEELRKALEGQDDVETPPDLFDAVMARIGLQRLVDSEEQEFQKALEEHAHIDAPADLLKTVMSRIAQEASPSEQTGGWLSGFRTFFRESMTWSPGVLPLASALAILLVVSTVATLQLVRVRHDLAGVHAKLERLAEGRGGAKLQSVVTTEPGEILCIPEDRLGNTVTIVKDRFATLTPVTLCFYPIRKRLDTATAAGERRGDNTVAYTHIEESTRPGYARKK